MGRAAYFRISPFRAELRQFTALCDNRFDVSDKDKGKHQHPVASLFARGEPPSQIAAVVGAAAAQQPVANVRDRACIQYMVGVCKQTRITTDNSHLRPMAKNLWHSVTVGEGSPSGRATIALNSLG
jgi:hypothetical protein